MGIGEMGRGLVLHGNGLDRELSELFTYTTVLTG